MTFSEINSKLKEYRLFSFHHRLIYRVSLFINSLLVNDNAPKLLSNKLKQKLLVNNHYNLRSNNTKMVVIHRVNTTYGDRNFESVFGKIINNIKSCDFTERALTFKRNLLNHNLHIILEKSLSLFPKLNCDLLFLNFYY